jgi:hypothetical protein
MAVETSAGVLVNIFARARAAEAEVLIVLFHVLDAYRSIPAPVLHFTMGWIPPPLFILQWAGFLRPCNRLDLSACF